MRHGRFLGIFLVIALAPVAGAQNIRDDRDFFRPSTRQWSFDVSVASLFDSNIDRDELEQSAQGVESGFVARYRDRGRRHRFWIRYKGGAQFYNHSDRWNGARSQLEAVLERNVGSRFILGGIGGHSLKVSSDDRELTHELAATPLLELKMTRSTRLLTYGGFELRRPANVEDVQRIRSAGAEVVAELGNVSLFRIGYRFEKSASERTSRRYDRDTFVVGYDADFGPTGLRFELERRERLFPDRLVEVGELEVPRLDVRWIPSASWEHELPGGHRLRLKYEYETRTSNDPGRAFRGHRVEFSVRLPLTGRIAVRPPRGGDGLGLPATVLEADEIRFLAEQDEFRRVAGGGFFRGSDWKDVLKVQGVPTNISERPRFYEELWFYGDSWVVLKAGRVVSWQDSGNLNVAGPENDDGAYVAPAPGPAEDRPPVDETPSKAVARIAPSEIVLEDGTRIEGRLQKYENGLAYIVITIGPNERRLLTTLPETLIDKDATERARESVRGGEPR